MSDRATDHLQPQTKRRPGGQLTKDAHDEDEDGPSVDPGTWGKADQATMARRKVIKVRRGAAAEASNADVAPANPFAGRSLLGSAAPSAAPDASGKAEQETKAKEGADANAPTTEPSPAADASGADDQKEAPPAAAAVVSAADTEDISPTGEAANEHMDEKDNKAAAAEQKETKEQKEQAPDGTAATAAAGGSTAVFGSLGSSGGGFGSVGQTAGGFGTFGSGLGGGGGFAGFSSFAAAGSSGQGFGGFGGASSTGTGASLFGGFSASPPALGAGAAGGNGAKEDEEGGGGDAAVFGADTPPVVTLKEVAKVTGEENERAIFAVDGVLYEFQDDNWRERGRGEYRINQDPATGRCRMVMRQRGSQRLLMNAALYAGMSTSKMVGGKGVTFAVVNAAVGAAAAGEGAGEEKEKGADGGKQEEEQAGGSQEAHGAHSAGIRTYALKSKASDKIEEFIQVVAAYKGGTAEAKAAGGDGANSGGGWGGAPEKGEAWV